MSVPCQQRTAIVQPGLLKPRELISLARKFGEKRVSFPISGLIGEADRGEEQRRFEGRIARISRDEQRRRSFKITLDVTIHAEGKLLVGLIRRGIGHSSSKLSQAIVNARGQKSHQSTVRDNKSANGITFWCADGANCPEKSPRSRVGYLNLVLQGVMGPVNPSGYHNVCSGFVRKIENGVISSLSRSPAYEPARANRGLGRHAGDDTRPLEAFGEPVHGGDSQIIEGAITSQVVEFPNHDSGRCAEPRRRSQPLPCEQGSRCDCDNDSCPHDRPAWKRETLLALGRSAHAQTRRQRETGRRGPRPARA